MKAALAAWVLCVALAGTSLGAVVLRADYEGGSRDSGIRGLRAVSPAADDAIAVSSDFARSGRRSLRAKVAFSPDYVSHGAPRAESDTGAVPESRYSEGDRFRYRFSLLLAPEWEPDSRGSIDIVFQCKRDAARPDLFVAVKQSDLVLRVLGTGQQVLRFGVKPAEWTDVSLDVRWSSGADGVIDAYVGAGGRELTRVASLRGPNIPPGAKARDAYVKWGLYKPAFAKSSFAGQARVVYHDDVSIERLED